MGKYLRPLAVLVSSVVLVAVAAPSVWGGKPLRDRIDLDVTFHDEFLSDECGFDVTTNQRGHIIIREWPDRDSGTVALNTINFALTAMANGNSYRFRDVGADHLKATKEGPILSITGQIPFDFTGVLKINLETGEAIHEPRHSTAGRLEEACAALSA